MTGGRAASIVKHPASPQLAALFEGNSGWVKWIEDDVGDVYSLATEKVPNKNAELVFAKPTDPASLVAEPSQANRDVRLRPSHMLAEQLDPTHRPGFGGDEHDHHLAEAEHIHGSLLRSLRIFRIKKAPAQGPGLTGARLRTPCRKFPS